jgi:Flp pilus assembly pilin Flp
VTSIVSGIWTSIKTTFQNIYNSISSVVSNIYNSIRSKFTSAESAMTSPISRAKGVIDGILSKISGAFSGLNWSFPKIKLPRLKITRGYKDFMGQEIPYPKFAVDWYARGGIFDEETVIGVAERGREAVVPLEGRAVRPFAEEVARMIPASATPTGILMVGKLLGR